MQYNGIHVSIKIKECTSIEIFMTSFWINQICNLGNFFEDLSWTGYLKELISEQRSVIILWKTLLYIFVSIAIFSL